MTAVLPDILMIITLGVLGGTGAGLFIGFIARKQEREWAAMQNKDILTNVLLIVVCSAGISAVLAWYLFVYSGA